jgi:hypothetical protein
MAKCKECGRALKTSKAIAQGFGPECASKIKMREERSFMNAKKENEKIITNKEVVMSASFEARALLRAVGSDNSPVNKENEGAWFTIAAQVAMMSYDAADVFVLFVGEDAEAYGIDTDPLLDIISSMIYDQRKAA